MFGLPDIKSLLLWLIGEDAPVEAALGPTEAMLMAIGMFMIAGGYLFIMAWREKIKRDERTRRLIADERVISKFRRM